MPLDEPVVTRLRQLIEESEELSAGDESANSREQCFDCEAWLVSAQNAVQAICESPESPYRKKVDGIAAIDHEWTVNNAVGTVSSILRSLLADAEAGLLVSVADRARAEILDDFLDSADSYLALNRKNEAGVVAGVAFEDGVRRICRKVDIPEKGLKLDDLISRLASGGDFSGVQAKRARVAAHVRTKASHAQWDEFTAHDVQATIDFTREILASKLDG